MVEGVITTGQLEIIVQESHSPGDASIRSLRCTGIKPISRPLLQIHLIHFPRTPTLPPVDPSPPSSLSHPQNHNFRYDGDTKSHVVNHSVTILPPIPHLLSILSAHTFPETLPVESESRNVTILSASALLRINGPVQIIRDADLCSVRLQALLERYAFRASQVQQPIHESILSHVRAMSSLAWTKATRQTQAAENGVQSVLQSTLADVINDLLSKPPFGQGSSHRIYWRLAGGGGGGQADLELVLEYENRAGQRERRILAVIEVKKSSALSVVGMGMLDDAVRDSGMWLDHQGKARVGIGREEDAVDRKYKAIFEQVRFLPPLSTTI